ncbi:MAG: hypothetical protein IJX78_03855 [Bacilli bacterium]|nr:hypothetical protein [Bacilli bacterium]
MFNINLSIYKESKQYFQLNDDFYVCEVNSNAYVTGFEKYTRIKIAKHYVKYILSEIYG